MKKILLLICLIAVLLVVGCASDKTTKEKSKATSPAISGAATTETPKVVGKTVTPTVSTTDSKVAEIKSAETKTISAAIATGTIHAIGKKGFNPLKTTAKKGDTLTFLNKNPLDRNVIITLQNKKTGKVTNSNQIPPGKTYEHTFKEAGEFKVWDVSFGVMGEIVVK